MSFDIFLSCMNNNGAETFKRQVAQEILGRGAVKVAGDFSHVEYPDGSASSIIGEEDEDIDGLMFNHSGGDTFFERMWELADRTGSIIFWPGDGAPVAVTREEMLQYIPKDDDGQPMEPQFVVKNGKELQDVIYETS